MMIFFHVSGEKESQERESQLKEQINQLWTNLQQNEQQLNEAQREITSNNQISTQISDALSARDKAMDTNRGMINIHEWKQTVPNFTGNNFHKLYFPTLVDSTHLK